MIPYNYQLEMAAGKGNLEDVKRYFETSTNIQFCMNIAAHNRHWKVIDYFLSKGIYSEGVILSAIRSRKLYIIDEMYTLGMSNLSRHTTAFYAARYGYYELVEKMIPFVLPIFVDVYAEEAEIHGHFGVAAKIRLLKIKV